MIEVEPDAGAGWLMASQMSNMRLQESMATEKLPVSTAFSTSSACSSRRTTSEPGILGTLKAGQSFLGVGVVQKARTTHALIRQPKKWVLRDEMTFLISSKMQGKIRTSVEMCVKLARWKNTFR